MDFALAAFYCAGSPDAKSLEAEGGYKKQAESVDVQPSHEGSIPYLQKLDSLLMAS